MKTKMFAVYMVLVIAAFHASVAQEEGSFREKVDDIRKKKLLEDLNLSYEKSEVFIKIYDAFMEQERNLHREKRDVFKRLVHMSALGDEMPGNSIMKTLDQVNEIDMKILSNHASFIKDMEKKLTPAQIARVVVFEQNFQMKMREKVFEFRTKKHKMKQFYVPSQPSWEEEME
ncbi:hypothetical protein JNM05_01640 [bacterium]|nr:hypothetical protein [bacterium]